VVKTIDIGARQIGPGHPCFVIAEAGVNHNGDIALARQLVDVAATAGADAVKFQTFKAEQLVTGDAPKADYQKQTTGAAESQFEMLKRLELTHEMHVELMACCRGRGIQFLSTPFEEDSADELIGLGLKLLKIPSGEITNLPFLAHIAGKRVPVILSTGMASLGEVEQAVEVFRAAGNAQLALLHCVSNYPADPVDANLRAMQTMTAAFGVPVGFSDHTLGIEVALAAVALGACIIEKHFTLDRSLPGPDHRASLEPEELRLMIRSIRHVEASLGDGRKRPAPSEKSTAMAARKSLVAARTIAQGENIVEESIAIKRPGTGLLPALRPHLLGRRARQMIRAGEILRLEMFD
jgi:N-acetylneuraminate synthase